MTRRQLLTRAAGAGALAVAGGGAFAATQLTGGGRSRTKGPAAVRTFVSRPDLRPPGVVVSGRGESPGYLFVGPTAHGGALNGPLAVDGDGEPVWFAPVADWATNVRADTYRGQPVLRWWSGKRIPTGYGHGDGFVVDRSYAEVAHVRAGNGRSMDMHEFRLTPEGTALCTCYPEVVPADLTSVGGPRHGHVYESIVQEVDVATGRVLLEWRALDHIPISDSYRTFADPYDYMHANTVAVAPDGNLLISGRHTWSVYKIDRQTGEVIWRLGGKRSDFEVEPAARFAWQHDSLYPAPGMITMFDNGSDGPTTTQTESRALVLAIDETARRVRLVRAYRHPQGLLARAMGSLQLLPSGHAIVGWGTEPYVSEFSPDGALLADAKLPSTDNSYRGFRMPWTGVPGDPPAIAAKRDGSGRATVYVSWNGATEVTHWQLHAGPNADALRPAGVIRRQGFETAIGLGTHAGRFAVTALDSAGRPLRRSGVVAI